MGKRRIQRRTGDEVMLWMKDAEVDEEMKKEEKKNRRLNDAVDEGCGTRKKKPQERETDAAEGRYKRRV